MKNIILLTSLALISTNTVYADFALSAKDGSINCGGQGLEFLKISANRKTFSVLTEGDEGNVQIFKISKGNSDGDSYVTYGSSENNGPYVTLSDQGDTLTWSKDVSPTPLKCR